MIAGIFARFIAPYLMYAAIGGSVLLAAGGVLWGYGHHKFNAGYDQAIADIDAETKQGVQDALGNVKQSRACRDAGRTWSQSDGVCR